MNEIDTQDRIKNARRRVTLNYHEAEIEKAGNALSGAFKRLFIDPSEPWLCSHQTLEAYLRERFNMTPRRKQQIMAGEGIRDMLMLEEGGAEIAPKLNERQLRELGTVPAEKRVEVALEAAKAPKLTTNAIKQAKARVVGTEQNLPMHTDPRPAVTVNCQACEEDSRNEPGPCEHIPSGHQVDPPTEAESNSPPAGHSRPHEIAEMLAAHGIIDECAVHDSEGYDGGKMMERIAKFTESLRCPTCKRPL